MRFLVKVPAEKTLDGVAVIAAGSGLDWSVSQIPMEKLLTEKGVTYENAEVRVLSANAPRPKTGLIYGNQLWIDTTPYASSRFTKGYAVVLQDIRDAQDNSVGYVVALPNGQVVRVGAEELLKHCEAARAKGEYFVQNMQYVGKNSLKASHLKNFEGKTVPIYRLAGPNNISAASVETKTIVHKVLVLDINPETVLDYTVQVETPDKVEANSVAKVIDASAALLQRRLDGIKPSELTPEQEIMINNYVLFVTQFPQKLAVYGLVTLTRKVSAAVGYLGTVKFKEKYPDVYTKFIVSANLSK
jgi:hypothetical protein